MRLFRALGAAVSLACAANAVSEPILHDKRSFVERDGVNYTVFEHAATGARLEFVKNSGICETTPGVNQYSGYLSVGTNMNMWFWYGPASCSVTSLASADSYCCRLGSSNRVATLLRTRWSLGSMAALAVRR